MRIAMVPVFVSDQERALEFYRDKLGFEVVMDNPYTGYGADEKQLRWITVAPDPAGTQLILYAPEMAPGGAESIRSRVGQWTGIVLQTDDVMATYRELVDRGVEFDSEPQQQPWGGAETWFSDPDGNRFHLGS